MLLQGSNTPPLSVQDYRLAASHAHYFFASCKQALVGSDSWLRTNKLALDTAAASILL